MLTISRSSDCKSYTDSYSYTSLRPFRPNIFYKLIIWLYVKCCYLCRLCSSLVVRFRRPISSQNPNLETSACCSHFVALSQSEKAFCESSTRDSSLNSKTRIKTCSSTLSSFMRKHIAQPRATLASILHRAHIIGQRELHSPTAATSCLRDSRVQILILSLSLAAALVVVCLLWAIFVFELPSSPIVILPIILLGAIVNKDGAFSLPLFAFWRYFRALFLLALPRVATRRGRFLIYSLIFYLITANTLKSLLSNSSGSAETLICIFNRTLEEGKIRLTNLTSRATSESYHDLLEIYHKVSGLVDKLNEVMNKSVSTSIDAKNKSTLSKEEFTVRHNLTLVQFNQWLTEYRERLDSLIQFANLASHLLKIAHKIMMCVALVILVIECIWFIYRFKNGKLVLPSSGPITDSQTSEFPFQSEHASPHQFQQSITHLEIQMQDCEQRVWSTRHHYNLIFPSFLHFKSIHPRLNNASDALSTTKLTTSSTASTLLKSTSRPYTKRPVLLQAISEPHQRTYLSDSDISPIEVNIAPLCISNNGLITNAPLLLPELCEPEFAISAPLAEEEEITELGSEIKEVNKEPSLVHSRPLNILPYSPPLIINSKIKKYEEVIMPAPIINKSKSSFESSTGPDKLCSSKSTKKTKLEKTYESKVEMRTSITIVCRLCFFLFHALFALLLIVGDIVLYSLMSYYYNINLDEIQRSDTVFCPILSSTRTTSYSSSFGTQPTTKVSSSECHKDPNNFPPLIEGGVEVKVIGREVRVPFELHIQTRKCLAAPDHPESTPIIIGIIVLSYALILFGIMWEKRFVYKTSIRIALAIYGKPNASSNLRK